MRQMASLVVKSLGLYWSSSKTYTIALLLVIPGQGLILPFSLLISRSLVNQISLEVNGSGNVIVLLFLLWLVLSLVQSCLRPLEMVFQGLMTDQMIAHINQNLMAKASNLKGLAYFEDPSFYDDIQLLGEEADWRPVNLIVFMAGVSRSLVTGIAILIILASYTPWLPLFIFLAILPQVLVSYRLQREAFESLVTKSPEARKMNYYRSAVLTKDFVKESKLYNLGSFFIDKYESAFKVGQADVKRVRYKQLTVSLIFSLIGTAGIALAFWWMIRRSLSRQVKPGDILVFLSSLFMAWDSLTSLVEESTLLYDTLLYMERYFRFLTLPSDVPEVNQPLLTNNRQEFTIEFKGVDFKYPHADRNVLKNFNLTIKNGDLIALLGENGAGKTTLIKLLTRFYIPDKGKIMLNGQDIQKIQIEDYRKLLTVVFQDPAHYPLTLAENIRLSKLDKENSSFWLKQAVQFAGLTEIVKHSVKGLDQILTNDFEGERDLSGGQWQAISLARA